MRTPSWSSSTYCGSTTPCLARRRTRRRTCLILSTRTTSIVTKTPRSGKSLFFPNQCGSKVTSGAGYSGPASSRFPCTSPRSAQHDAEPRQRYRVSPTSGKRPCVRLSATIPGCRVPCQVTTTFAFGMSYGCKPEVRQGRRQSSWALAQATPPPAPRAQSPRPHHRYRRG